MISWLMNVMLSATASTEPTSTDPFFRTRFEATEAELGSRSTALRKKEMEQAGSALMAVTTPLIWTFVNLASEKGATTAVRHPAKSMVILPNSKLPLLIKPLDNVKAQYGPSITYGKATEEIVLLLKSKLSK